MRLNDTRQLDLFDSIRIAPCPGLGMIVDLFAGGGGASAGIERAMGRPIDLAINHDFDALRNHALNHPKTRHMVDDIRKVSPLGATGGRPVDLLWASPDCRHFSRSKGGKPCHPEVRELPWNVVRWARETTPRLIAMENVPEFEDWGPLYGDHNNGCKRTHDLETPAASWEECDDGCHFAKPIPERKGETFSEWTGQLRALGYDVESKVLHAHHYGTPTSRKRLFIVARRDGLPIEWPAPTHGPGLMPYRTAAECIDWSDLGESIFDAEGNTHHAPATLKRIATGIMRYVVEAQRPFLVQTGYGERAGQAPRVMSVDAPLGTVVAGGQKHALVSAFLAKHYGSKRHADVGAHDTTVTSVDHHSLVAAHMIKVNHGRDPFRGQGMDAPISTITSGYHGHAIVAAFLSTYYGQSVGRGVNEPMATLTTRDRHALVTVTIDGVSYAIVDIRMRMLKPDPELKLAQGFPASYRIEGTARLKTRLIGNSVPPQLAEAVVRANTPQNTKTRPRAVVA